jgi:hypothetical protein
MNKTKNIRYILVFALAATLSLTVSSKQTQAAYSCPGTDAGTICYNADGPRSDCDSDADGYTDAQECTGITLPFGALEGDPGSVTYKYGASFTENNMDPTQKDLFLIIVDAEDPGNDECSGQSSLLPADLLYPSTNPESLLGLGLNVHVINDSQAGPGQAITSGPDGQNAVKMTESCSTADLDVAGEAIPGIPNRNALSGTVFTYVIQTKINNACQSGFTCYDGDTLSDADTLRIKHIINTFNHEVGHMLGLSVNIDRKVGNHWKVGTGNELDQFVDCSSNSRKRTASCSVPDTHGAPDIAGYRLYQ